MGSSASTPSPPRSAEVPLLIVFADEDDPRRCSGRRLVRSEMARAIPDGRSPPHGAVLLDPHSAVPLSRADRDRALQGGVVAVDCSWNRIGATGQYPPQLRGLDRLRLRRRLPWLVAANPQHHGRLGELNTAEALAASLVLLGERGRAGRLLGPFPGGPTFFDLNAAAFAAYARAPDAHAIIALETAPPRASPSDRAP